MLDFDHTAGGCRLARTWSTLAACEGVVSTVTPAVAALQPGLLTTSPAGWGRASAGMMGLRGRALKRVKA